MARKNYPDEFRRDAVELYRDTDGATITGIAAELGIRGTLSAWCKAPACRSGTATPPPPTAPAPGVETPEQELARLRAEDRAAAGGEDPAGHRAGHPAVGGQIFRRGDELVNRFQFVADHWDTFEVKRLCEVIEIARSSFYAWMARRAEHGPPSRR